MRIDECDGGCGATSKDPTAEGWIVAGMIAPRSYCPKCGKDAKAYMDELNRIHTEAAQLFYEGISQASQAFKTAHPQGRVPDEHTH